MRRRLGPVQPKCRNVSPGAARGAAIAKEAVLLTGQREGRRLTRLADGIEPDRPSAPAPPATALDPREALGRTEASRSLAARALFEAMANRGSDAARAELAQIALIFDPEGDADTLSEAISGLVSSVHGPDSPAPVLAFYEPFADTALPVRWSAGAETVEAVEMVPGAPGGRPWGWRCRWPSG